LLAFATAGARCPGMGTIPKSPRSGSINPTVLYACNYAWLDPARTMSEIPEDFLDIVRCLREEACEFAIVGAFALAFHGHPRATQDIDIWVRPSPENSVNVSAHCLNTVHRFKHMEYRRRTSRSQAMSTKSAFHLFASIC